ncbi:MAG: PfkB family carbohydrate kinase [Parachlamydiales bacterium]
MDLILRVPHDFLDSVPGKRGGMEPITHRAMQEMVARSGVQPVTCPGGSAANMLRGLARLGHPCAIVGKRGLDPMGEHYVRAMKEVGVGGALTETPTPNTIVLSLVEPCGMRTMRTYMGASQELQAAELDPEAFKGIRHLHIEGYAFYNQRPMERAIELAKREGATISLDLASFEVVGRFFASIVETLREQVDLVFANELEAEEITGERCEQAVECLGEWCETAVVMLGRKGGLVKRGSEKIRYSADVVEDPIDTTGAGDLFASGFVSGMLKGRPIEECARAGALAGRAVVQVIGAVIPESRWPALLRQMPGGSPAGRPQDRPSRAQPSLV